MAPPIPQSAQMRSEIIFTTSRSSGPGGQNVNKVNSKITLKLDIRNSEILTEEQKEILLKKLASKLTKDGVLILMAQDSRSQIDNKEAAILKLDQLLTKAFTPRKTRKPTKPSKASQRARVNDKKQHGEKKQWRQRPD